MIHRNGIYSQFRDAATTPTASQKLEAEGYCLLPQLFSEHEVEALRRDIDRVFDTTPADGRAANRSAAEDNMFRYEMFNRSEVCQTAVGKQALLEVIEPLLGEDCHIIANTAWRNEAGFVADHGGGGWHIDAGPHIPLAEGVQWPADIPHPVFAIGVHIYLQDCRIEDGPTGVIPGSHLSGQFPPPDRNKDDALTWQGRGVVPLLAQAGDVGLFVSDVWHRRMPTLESDHGRYFLQVHYGRRDIAQRIKPTASVNHVSPEAMQRIKSRRERQLLGLHKNFFYDG